MLITLYIVVNNYLKINVLYWVLSVGFVCVCTTSNEHQQHQKPNEQTKSKSQNIWQEKTKSAAPPPKKIGFSNAVAVRIMG